MKLSGYVFRNEFEMSGAEKKKESRVIAENIVSQHDTTEEDYALGFAINRNHEEDGRARQLFFEAVERFGSLSSSFTKAAYAFAAESGDAEMRSTLAALKE